MYSRAESSHLGLHYSIQLMLVVACTMLVLLMNIVIIPLSPAVIHEYDLKDASRDRIVQLLF